MARLGEKLRSSGLHEKGVKLLLSWLEDRISQIVVGGASSPEEILADSVFQGTVLGPPLWNFLNLTGGPGVPDAC